MHEPEITSVSDPGPAPISRGFRQQLWAGLAIGLVLFLIGLKVETNRVWDSFLVNYFYFLVLGLGGLFLVALEYCTSATWSVVFRRLAEAVASYLPWALVLGVALLAGVRHIYPWAHAGFHFDRVNKAQYFNLAFFGTRAFIYLALWTLFGWFFVSRSLRQDRQGGQINARVAAGFGKLSSLNGRMAAAFMVIFAVTFTLASVDWIMSLQPDWSSSMFGVYTFAGLFEAALALMIILAVMMRRRGWLGEIVTDRHYVDLARMLHAFCIFMVYIGFEQYFLIWYSNFPDETSFFHRRIMGGWGWIFLFLLFAKWVFPFCILLNQKVRKNENVILTMAWLVMIAEWLDIYWLVLPARHAGFVLPGWTDLGVFLIFFALFGLTVSRLLRRHSTVPIGDPKLVNSVAGRYLA